MRADALVVSLGICPTRSKAAEMIREGRILADGQVVDKPSRNLAEGVTLSLLPGQDFVSRAGHKLEGFLEQHAIEVTGLRALDLGASTGGFTDCLLQRGAESVICVDVGHDQLHPSLREDTRVTNLEGRNARELEPSDLPGAPYPLLVMDLSFISLRAVLPAAWKLLEAGGLLIALIKPQFECPPAARNRQGIVRREEDCLSAVAQIEATGRELGAIETLGPSESQKQGSDGNREWLIGLRRG